LQSAAGTEQELSNSFPDQELAEKVAALVERGHMGRGDPAYGVALAAIDLGYDRLTRAQRGLYDRVVAPAMDALDKGVAPATPASPLAAASPALPERRQAAGIDGWKPIREAPDDHDVQLAMMVDGKVNALTFPCRRSKRTWVQSATGKPVFFKPTQWREWRG
jgi:hypothetical protein